MQNMEKQNMEKNMEENVKKRKVGNRRRIEIKKIANKSYLHTTFTKRRNGLFNKTRDLCTLGGANAAVIVFSPCGNPYTFGSPSVDSIIDRYFNERPVMHVDGDLDGDNEVCSESEQTTMESVQENGDRFWWNKSVEGLDIHQLKQFRASLLELKKSVVSQLEETRMRNMALRDFFPADSTINK